MGSSTLPYSHAVYKPTKIIKNKGEIICYLPLHSCSSQSPPPKRGSVKGLSVKSSCRLKRYLKNCDTNYRYMITLTYPKEWPTDISESKEHLRAFMAACRRRADTKELWSACWVLEFQKRGAPHYHILTNNYLEFQWVAETWARITSGDRRACSRVERIASADKMIGYMASYLGKKSQKMIPKDVEKVGRFWGVYGNRQCTSVSADLEFMPTEILSSVHQLCFASENVGQVLREKGLFIKQFDHSDGNSGFYIGIDRAHGYRGLEIIWRYLQDVFNIVGRIENTQEFIDQATLLE